MTTLRDKATATARARLLVSRYPGDVSLDVLLRVLDMTVDALLVRVVETNDGTWPALPIDQWVARYGRPGIHYAQIENDS